MRFKVSVPRKSLSLLCALALTAGVCLPTSAVVERAQAASGEDFTQDGITYVVSGDSTVNVGTAEGTTAIDLATTGTDVTLPETVSDGTDTYTVAGVASYAFSYLDSGLESVSLPKTVQRLGDFAFAYCGRMDESKDPVQYSGLTTLNIPADTELSFVGTKCFMRDYALQAFTIPASVTGLSTGAFISCFSFDRLEFEEGSTITSISDSLFELEWQDGQVKPKEWTNSSDDLTSVDWKNVATIEEDVEASLDYGGLKSVELPATVEGDLDVGIKAFCNQRNLVSVDFGGEEISRIQNYSFAFCTSLTDFSMPSAGAMQDENTGYQYAYGQYAFTGCVGLESFTFNGKIKSPSGRWSELCMFDGCINLDSVIYGVNRVTPASAWHRDNPTAAGNTGGERVDLGFNSSDPTIYCRVAFYDSSLSELADRYGKSEYLLGDAAVREGITVSAIKNDMAVKDAEGTVIWTGEVPALPAGYDAWAFQYTTTYDPLPYSDYTFYDEPTDRTITATSKITNPVVAYPIGSTDLDAAGIDLSEDAFWYTGTDHRPDVTVIDATGDELTEGSDYTLSWEREGASGWEATDDFSSVGTVRVTASPAAGSAYTGSTSKTYQIAYLAEGATVTSGGITYKVTKDQTPASSAEVQVGDGAGLAVDASVSGTLTVPSSITLEGSEQPVYVTSVGNNAFGSSDADIACTGIDEVVLPDTIVAIGDYAFSNMTSLRTVTFPASLQTIGSEAYAYDTLLSSVTFEGATLEEIGVGAFQYCSSIRSLSLPAVTGSIRGRAFMNCTMLQTVTFTGSVAASNASQFSGCERLAVVIFDGNEWNYGFDSSVTIYYGVTFYKTDAKTSLGYAAIEKGTALSSITDRLSSSYIADGSVPALPAGTNSWDFRDVSGSTLTCATRAVATKTATTSGGTQGKTYTAGSKASKAVYKIVSSAKATVAYASCKSTSKTKATVPASVRIKNKTYTVVQVAKKAFKGTKVKTVTVKSKKITAFKKAFKGSKVKTVKVPKAKKKAYRKLLSKARCGAKVKVK